MTDQSPPTSGPDLGSVEIDTTVAHAARLQNYLAGGGGNFTVDRELAEAVAELLPGGIDTARAGVQVLHDFMTTTVRHLAGAGGVQQFLNVGTPVPGTSDLHTVAQAVAPAARVVYVGNDPVVLAHAHDLRRSTPEGATAYVHASLRQTAEIVRQAGETLDLARPVAVTLLTTLNFVPDDLDPHALVAALLDAVPSGSYLVIAHAAQRDGWSHAVERLTRNLRESFVVRSRQEITRFFDGLELVGPGVVRLDQWQPNGAAPTPDPELPIPMYGGVARKP